MAKSLHIRLSRCLLILYEDELLRLLSLDKDLWTMAVRRRKGQMRAAASNARLRKQQKEDANEL